MTTASGKKYKAALQKEEEFLTELQRKLKSQLSYLKVEEAALLKLISNSGNTAALQTSTPTMAPASSVQLSTENTSNDNHGVDVTIAEDVNVNVVPLKGMDDDFVNCETTDKFLIESLEFPVKEECLEEEDTDEEMGEEEDDEDNS